MNRHASIALLTTTLSLLPTLAAAHGGEPIAREALRSDDQGGWALVTNFGIMTSQDLTHYVCEEAFLGGADFRAVALGPTTWLTFSRSAIMKTEDGCSFRQIAPLKRAPAAAIASGQRVLYASNQDGERGIFISDDAGEHFGLLALPGATDVIWTGLVALDDGVVVASGYDSSAGATRGAALLWRIAADDSAVALSAPAGASYPYLMAGGGSRFAGLMGLGDAQVALWAEVSATGLGQLVQHPLERWPSGMAMSRDGQTLHIAGASQMGGLWRGTWGQDPSDWEIIAPEHPARCVSQPADELLVCASRMTQAHDLSAVDASGAWTERVRFQELLGPRRGCPAGSQVREVCPAVWGELAVALRVPADREPPEQTGGDADMGAPEHGADMPPGPPAEQASDDDGCSSAGGAASWPAALLALLITPLGRRARRRRAAR
jgi:hypothetical protein